MDMNPSEMTEQNTFSDILNQYSLNLSQKQIFQLTEYLVLLSQWSKTYNLTAIYNPKEMVIKHVLDSLSVSPYLHGQMILDVGTGAGLPGIVLAVLKPDSSFTLLDRTAKKTRFLNHVKAMLNLDNVQIVHSRVESFEVSEKFSSIISRAFASLNNFFTMTQHLLAEDGVWLAMKGKQPDDELAELPETIDVANIESLSVPDLFETRYIVVASNNR